jgi:hypothetical protein
MQQGGLDEVQHLPVRDGARPQQRAGRSVVWIGD